MRLPILFASLLFIVSGCSQIPRYYADLPQERLLTKIGLTDQFAVHPDGDMVVFVADGLELLRISDGYRQRLLFDRPDCFAWATDGRQLVVAIPEGEKTRLVTLTSDAAQRSQVLVDEQIHALAWLSDSRVLALAETVAEAVDRISVQVVLLSWDGERDVERKPLYRFSYQKPLLAKGQFPNPIRQQFDLSPLKDELVYTRHAAPLSEDRPVQVVLHHLQTGDEMVLAEVHNRQAGALFAADGESLLLPRAQDVTLLDPRDKSVRFHWPGRGEQLTIAPGRDLFLIDGQLIDNQQLLLEFAGIVKGLFSQDGARLFIVKNHKLYLFDGYPVPDEIGYSELERVKLQNIRLQRSQGEIDQKSYSQARTNILHP